MERAYCRRAGIFEQRGRQARKIEIFASWAGAYYDISRAVVVNQRYFVEMQIFRALLVLIVSVLRTASNLS